MAEPNKPTYADLECSLQFYKEREAHFARVLSVADGGRYRADWNARIEELVSENKRLSEENEDLRRRLAKTYEGLEVGLSGEPPFPGRKVAPTNAEIEAHSNTDGVWLIRIDDPLYAKEPAEVPGSGAKYHRDKGHVTEWWALDKHRQYTAWPKVQR